MSYIVPLGSGKLFIAEFFETKEKVDMKGGGWVYAWAYPAGGPGGPWPTQIFWQFLFT
jgi:hypothetical protein